MSAKDFSFVSVCAYVETWISQKLVWVTICQASLVKTGNQQLADNYDNVSAPKNVPTEQAAFLVLYDCQSQGIILFLFIQVQGSKGWNCSWMLDGYKVLHRKWKEGNKSHTTQFTYTKPCHWHFIITTLVVITKITSYSFQHWKAGSPENLNSS